MAQRFKIYFLFCFCIHLIFSASALGAEDDADAIHSNVNNEKSDFDNVLNQVDANEEQPPASEVVLSNKSSKAKLPSPQKPPKKNRFKVCNFCFWLGAGGDYLSFEQSSQLNKNLYTYSEFGAPSLWMDFRLKLWGSLGLRGEYQSQSSGKIKAKEVQLEPNEIKWSIATVGFDYRLPSYFKLFNRPWIPTFLIAYQHHSMPFIYEIDSTHYKVEAFEFKTFSLGVYFDIFNSSQWHFLWTNRVQFPIGSSNDVQIKSGFSFDGTIGTIHKLSRHMAMAIYWGGQYHKYDYQTVAPKVVDQGSYSLLTSKLNLMLGINF